MDSATANRATPLREQARPVPGCDYGIVYAYPAGIIRFIVESHPSQPMTERLLYGRACLVLHDATPPSLPLDAFEAWLVERTLTAARSEAFRDTAEYEYLQAEWEEGR